MAQSGGLRTTASDFFIVDNSDEHWKALEYLRQWCQLSAAVDIATGYFEVGAFLALDGEWQKVDNDADSHRLGDVAADDEDALEGIE